MARAESDISGNRGRHGYAMDKLAFCKSISLPDLVHRLTGAKIRNGRSIASPLRPDDKCPSFCAWNKNGDWAWKDYGNGKGGGSVQFYQEYTGSTSPVKDLYQYWTGSAQPEKAYTPPPEREKLPPKPLPWSERVAKLSDGMLSNLSAWRGYSLDFCHWMKAEQIIGSYAEHYAFPIYAGADVVRYHVKWDNGWTYEPKNVATELSPLVIPAIEIVYRTHVFESQWDMLAAMCALSDASPEYVADCQWIATRGTGGRGLPDVDYVWRQRDTKPSAIESEARWASQFSGRSVWTPIGVKDANDWLKSEPRRFKRQLERWFL